MKWVLLYSARYVIRVLLLAGAVHRITSVVLQLTSYVRKIIKGHAAALNQIFQQTLADPEVCVACRVSLPFVSPRVA